MWFLYPYLLLFLSFSAAAEVALMEWQPVGYRYSFVIPRQLEESEAAAVARYLSALEANPELKPYAQSLRSAGFGRTQAFSPMGGSPTVLAVANDSKDLVANPERMNRVLDPLQGRGARALLAPVAVTTGLSPADGDSYRNQVSQQFDGLIAVGGDDIHPSLYGDPDPRGLAKETNLSRDLEELRLVRTYLEQGQGVFTGICRGHQMGGVASSCPLVKDIREELGLDHPRHVDHGIRVRPDAGRLTREIFDGSSSIQVMTNHHQAIRIPETPNPRLRVTAVAADQPAITEVVEYYGSRGISMQTHPELMPSSAFHARFYDILFGEVDRNHGRRTARPFRNIDLDRTLFGVEYTFQDQEMVNEPGRSTFETPHKRARFEQFKAAYLRELGVKPKALESFGSSDFKPGVTIPVPQDGNHVMNMEPVTIEVNTPPRRFHEIESAADKIFRASRAANLVPYVNPAAERSGMGHIHVGGRTLADSPFYRNPQLLRNIMVYIHKRPSVLWGFAEAYDIDTFREPGNGEYTNIETYHKPQQQAAFERAVKNFDEWYERTRRAGGDLSDGLRQYLRFLKAEERPGIRFFEHYRFINLEHLKFLANSRTPVEPSLAGKATVEFRNFRPPRTAQHAAAHSELLLAMMERMAKPGHLEPFEAVSPQAFDRFHSASRLAADWELVKRDLSRFNPLWDDSVGEYVRVQLGREAIRAELGPGIQGEIRPAYSAKAEKGTKFELRIPVSDYSPPNLMLGGRPLDFEKIQLEGKEFWLATFDANPESGLDAQIINRFGKEGGCARHFSLLK
jgi:putative glutamine amidotransferase